MNALNIFGVEACKDVVEETFVKGSALLLKIYHIAIDDKERLSISIERVDTTDGHICSLSYQSAAAGGVYVASQKVLNVGLYSCLVKHNLLLRNDGSSICVELGEFAAQEACILSGFALNG